MKKVYSGLLCLLCAVPAGADDQTKPKPEAAAQSDTPKKPADEIKALIKQHADAMQAFEKAFREAKTQEERNKVFQEKYPQPNKIDGRLLEVARKHLKDPAAVDALVWIVVNSGGPAQQDALALLADHHSTDSRVASLVDRLVYAESDHARRLLEALRTKSTDKEVRGKATMGLGLLLKQEADMARRLQHSTPDIANYIDQLRKQSPDRIARLEKAKPDDLLEEAKSYFARAKREYGDVKFGFRKQTISEVAEHNLFELENLVIGKQAPDIEGTDIDGQKFKLSDYRGKVVLLDFWGNW